MDIIATAEAKRDELKAELAKIEDFLTTAYELQGGLSEPKPVRERVLRVDEPKRYIPKVGKITPRKPPKSGLIYDTAMAAIEYMKEHGEGVPTRDLVPVVKAKGVSVGGTNEVGTISARMSQSFMFELRDGKWFILPSADEETADQPCKEESADSLFDNQGET